MESCSLVTIIFSPNVEYSKPIARILFIAAIFTAITCWSFRALAHNIGVSRGHYTRNGTQISLSLQLANQEITNVVREMDGDRDNKLNEIELLASRTRLDKAIVQKTVMKTGDSVCTGRLTQAQLVEQDGVELIAEFQCQSTDATEVSINWINEVPKGHRHFATYSTTEGTADVLLFGNQISFVLPSASSAPPVSPHQSAKFVDLLWMGIEHILTGWDHLLFLAGLVLVGGRVKGLIGVVTAFTVGHSISLALGAWSIFTPSPSIVEPAIAASIAFVGVENFYIKDPSTRWRLTLPFGLIHGFGFAGALTEISLSKDSIAQALFGFNLGVELGQLAVLSVVLPIVLWAHKNQSFHDKGYKWLSAVLVAVGVLLFIYRLTLPTRTRPATIFSTPFQSTRVAAAINIQCTDNSMINTSGFDIPNK